MDASLNRMPLSPQEQHNHFRRSMSTLFALSDMEKIGWEAPPVPPIPPDREDPAWKRRSLKRSSLASMMSGGTQLLEDQSANATTRPPSEASLRPTPKPCPKSNVPRKQSDAYAELHWEINYFNPRNWSAGKQWLHTMTVTAGAFTVTMASSTPAIASTSFSDTFKVLSAVAELPLAIFAAGLSVGALIGVPLSDVFGRKICYSLSFLLFAILTMIAGFVHNGYGIIVCRMLAGVSGSATLCVGSAIQSDMWKHSELALPLALYHLIAWLGPTVGMVLGGYVTKEKGLYWEEYVVLCAAAVCVLPILCMSETLKKRIQQRKQRKSLHPDDSGRFFSTDILGPLDMLFTKSLAFLLSLYNSFNFAVLYASFAVFPKIFAEVYGLGLRDQGLVYNSMLIGVVIAFSTFVVVEKTLISPRAKRWRDARTAEAEECVGAKRKDAKRCSTRQSSFVQSLKGTTIGSSRESVAAPFLEYEKIVTLAAAAAKYLNSQPENEGRAIIPERVQLLLNTNLAYSDLCEAVEGYKLKFDRVELAKVLADAMQCSDKEAVPRSSLPPVESSPGLVRLDKIHHATSATAMNMMRPRAYTANGAGPLIQRRLVIDPLSPSLRPPAEWRLILVLPSSVLLSGSLFFFGWATRPSFPLVVPCVALSIFAFSAILIFTGTQQFLIEHYGERDGLAADVGGVLLRYLFSFAFPLFAPQMYGKLGTAWACSVLGFVAMALGIIPWAIYLRWSL